MEKSLIKVNINNKTFKKPKPSEPCCFDCSAAATTSNIAILEIFVTIRKINIEKHHLLEKHAKQILCLLLDILV